MNVGIISDIHANIRPLEKSLNYLRSVKVEQIFCLGDIIGYGNYPNEVIDLLREEDIICIRGNHEKLFLEGIYREEYNLPFTRRVLTDRSLEYLNKLPLNITLKKFNAFLSHAIPSESENYFYANSDFTIFDSIDFEIIFIGHTHYPMLLSYYSKKIVNPGSVGQPRDGSKKPSFMICDLSRGRFELVRV